MSALTSDTAASMARIALGHVAREYPYKLEHVVTADEDVLAPHSLYPVFHGSYDWHSCVHGWWALLTVARLFPGLPEAERIVALANDSFTAEKVAGEVAYFQRPATRSFERPYGWAWLLYLHLEASRHQDRPWAGQLGLLARAIADRFRGYLPILTYPIRSGAHFNTAFALVLALEWAERFDPELAALIENRSLHWFGADRDCPVWEPGGDDFVSPALTEALCMARAHPALFADWFHAFLPRLRLHQPEALLMPAIVSDRSDPKVAHLDGLNLSRAWCWRSLGYPEHADAHLEAALPHLSGDYMGEHWLQSFALLALLAPSGT